jgi:iron complex transport system ATP-binding protein
MSKIISIEDLTFSYNKNPVLKNISLQINEGESIGILGPNGSGKTTLLKLISGILNGYSGKIKIFGKNINKFSRKELSQMISYIPQNLNINFDLLVETIVSFGRNPYIGLFKGLEKNDYTRIHNAMKEAEITHLKDRIFNTLSGGEKQRTSVAKSLAQDGNILLLDEFVTHLDPGHAQKILSLTKKLIDERHMTSIGVFHDINRAINICHKLVFLKEGKIQEKIKPENISVSLLKYIYEIQIKIIDNPYTGKPYVITK